VKLAGVVDALHAFQEKSRKGIATPKAELERVKDRLRVAQLDHRERAGSAKPKELSDEEED
jgi:phage-related protein